ncbi:MAG: hypothetical protein RL518_1454 [Pseudomonadota bacterium]|jgi:uncharacterized membrane protein
MNAAHLHIVLVHLPVVLVPTATIVLLLALLRKQSSVAKVALSLFVTASLFILPAFLIGEEAEEMIEHLPGIFEETIEEHAESANTAFWLTLAVGGIAMCSLTLQKRAPHLTQSALRFLVVAGTLTSGSLAYTAYEGGKIRHPEAYERSGQPEHSEEHEHD